MNFNYLVPSIVYLSPGTTCMLPIPWDQIGKQLGDGHGQVVCSGRVYCDGEIVGEFDKAVEFANAAVVDGASEPIVWNCDEAPLDRKPGFMECGIRTKNEEALFASKAPMAFYSNYFATGQKSYFSDNAWKYASPPVIAQIAEYGQYLDAYPAVRIDRDRDAGMTLILINPYRKAVLARIVTADGRKIERIRVQPMSVHRVPLVSLLEDDERSWIGQIQITANNRLVTYISWHSLENPDVISDLEHLDPYRGEPTHIPVSQHMRLSAGELLRDLNAKNRA